MTRSISTTLAALFISFLCLTRSSWAQSASPDALVENFVKAWNSHSAKAFDRLFTDDAIWVPVAEARVEGRGNIVKDLGEIHATWAKATTVVQSGREVRTLRPDCAVILFHAGYLDDHGQKVEGVDRAMLIVAVKGSDGWRISVGQITKQSPPS